MGFSDLLMGQFIDVIENDKDMSHLIVLKYQRNGRDNEIKQGQADCQRKSGCGVYEQGRAGGCVFRRLLYAEYGEYADSIHTAKLEIRLSITDNQ